MLTKLADGLNYKCKSQSAKELKKMSNETETTETTETTQTKRTRGRKPLSEGGTSTLKKIFCVCSAIQDGELVTEEIHCKESSNKNTNEEIKNEAISIFESKVGIAPVLTLGPYFYRKGVSQSKKKNNFSNLKLESVDFVKGQRGTALYKEWNVSVRFIENHKDAVFIMYQSHIGSNKKTKPQNKFVSINSLENLQTQTQTQTETQTETQS